MEYKLKSTANIEAVQYVNDIDELGENIPLKIAVDKLGLKEAWKQKGHPFTDATVFDGENKVHVPYGHYIVKTDSGFVALSPETMAMYEPLGDVAKEESDYIEDDKAKKTKK